MKVKTILNSPERASRINEGRSPMRTNRIVEQTETIDFTGVFRPERAARFSAGQRPAIRPVLKMSPVRAARILCKGVRRMRAALSGLCILSNVNVGLRPTLKRDALSGRNILLKSNKRPILNLEGEAPTSRDLECA